MIHHTHDRFIPYLVRARSWCSSSLCDISCRFLKHERGASSLRSSGLSDRGQVMYVNCKCRIVFCVSVWVICAFWVYVCTCVCVCVRACVCVCMCVCVNAYMCACVWMRVYGYWRIYNQGLKHRGIGLSNSTYDKTKTQTWKGFNDIIITLDNIVSLTGQSCHLKLFFVGTGFTTTKSLLACRLGPYNCYLQLLLLHSYG